ncbi:hypothetical protein D3C75_987840 [compost metagenome]
MLFQQWPARKIGRVIDNALHLHRPTLQLHVCAPAGQDHAGPGLLREPLDNLQALGRVPRGDIQVGGEAQVKPTDKRLAKTLGHAAHTNTGSQRQQKGDQRQAQGWQLLAAVSHEPLRQWPVATTRQPGQYPIEQRRQQQCRRQQQPCQHAERTEQAGPEHATAQGQQQQQAR